MYIQIKEEKTAILKIYLKTLKVLERQKFSKYFAPIDKVKIETCFRNNKKAKNRYLRTSRVACRVDLEPTADGRSDSYPPPSPTARTPR